MCKQWRYKKTDKHNQRVGPEHTSQARLAKHQVWPEGEDTSIFVGRHDGQKFGGVLKNSYCARPTPPCYQFQENMLMKAYMESLFVIAPKNESIFSLIYEMLKKQQKQSPRKIEKDQRQGVGGGGLAGRGSKRTNGQLQDK